MQVREVMTRDALVASPDDTIQKAATLMAQVNFGALPVGENDRLVDMITDRDIALRAVATGYARWFEQLLAELGFELWIGDPAEIMKPIERFTKRAVAVDAQANEEQGRPLFGVNGVVRSKKSLTEPTLLEMSGNCGSLNARPPDVD